MPLPPAVLIFAPRRLFRHRRARPGHRASTSVSHRRGESPLQGDLFPSCSRPYPRHREMGWRATRGERAIRGKVNSIRPCRMASPRWKGEARTRDKREARDAECRTASRPSFVMCGRPLGCKPRKQIPCTNATVHPTFNLTSRSQDGMARRMQQPVIVHRPTGQRPGYPRVPANSSSSSRQCRSAPGGS